MCIWLQALENAIKNLEAGTGAAMQPAHSYRKDPVRFSAVADLHFKPEHWEENSWDVRASRTPVVLYTVHANLVHALIIKQPSTYLH